MRAALVLEVSGTEVAAVIAGEHDQRLVELASSIEVVDEAAEVGVDTRAAREVLGVVPTPVAPPCREVARQLEVTETCRPAARSNGAESVVLVMRFEERQEQEERLVVVEAADPVDGEIGECIDSESVEIDTFV